MIDTIRIFLCIAEWYVLGFWRNMVHIHRVGYFWGICCNMCVIQIDFLLKNIKRNRGKLVLIACWQVLSMHRTSELTMVVMPNGLGFRLNNVVLKQ